MQRWDVAAPGSTRMAGAKRAGSVVSEGYHEYYSGLHAEIVALARAGDAARGRPLAVSLEPWLVIRERPGLRHGGPIAAGMGT